MHLICMFGKLIIIIESSVVLSTYHRQTAQQQFKSKIVQSLTLIYDDSQSTMIVMFSPSMGTGVLEYISLHLIWESKMFVNVVACNFVICVVVQWMRD